MFQASKLKANYALLPRGGQGSGLFAFGGSFIPVLKPQSSLAREVA